MGQVDLAIYLPDAVITPPHNPYGRLIANAGTYRALADHANVGDLHFQCRVPPAAEGLAGQLGVDPGRVSVSTPLHVAGPRRTGLLLSGQPYLAEPAWIRRQAGLDTRYSIVGTIFAYSSPPHRQRMMHSALAPLHEWDALICSSPTLRSTVAETFDRWQDYLGERVGATRLPRPQLPVIPFGARVDEVSAQAGDKAARLALRDELGIGPDDVMVYFLGRLSYYDKAFPQPMLKAVATAAARTGVTAHFVMTGWFPAGDEDRERFTSAARRHAPGVAVTFLDGNDDATVARCWAAADVFLLQSDTIIETFGQAVVEAMAAGLPVVVSDWDGYRYIVADGEDGYLVPTLGAPAGPLGRTLALMDSVEMLTYPSYAGTVAEHTAVDIEAASQRLADLMVSPELRRALGEAGRRHAKQRFDWRVVADLYLQLFEELSMRRGGSAAVTGRSMNPLRDDPFCDFVALPTTTLTDDTMLTWTGQAPSRHDFDDMFSMVRANLGETRQVLDGLAAGPRPLAEIVQDFPPGRRPFVRMTVMWLAKSGVLSWR